MDASVYHDGNTGKLSIVDRTGIDSETYGNVVSKCEMVKIEGAEFTTYEGKRKEAIETGISNVHAVIYGFVTEGIEPPDKDLQKISYHIDREGCFYISNTQQRVIKADVLFIDTRPTDKPPIMVAENVQTKTNQLNNNSNQQVEA